jgi:hypothetical protein
MYLGQAFIVKVKEVLEEEEQNRKEKAIVNTFLVKAYTVGDVEVQIANYYKNLNINYSIKSINQSQIKEVLVPDESESTTD